MDDAIGALISFYNFTEKSDIYHVIAGHILNNLGRLENASVYDLAEWCFTSPSTISRLVKKLGYGSYSIFKSKLTLALKDYRFLNRNMRNIDVMDRSDILPLYFNFLGNNINALKGELSYEQISKVADVIYEHSKIFIFSVIGIGLHGIQEDLIIIGKKVEYCNTGADRQHCLKDIDDDSLVLAIVPDLRGVADTIQCINQAKQKGAKIVMICSGKKLDYEKNADYILSFNGSKTAFDVHLFAIIVGIITWDFRLRYVDKLI